MSFRYKAGFIQEFFDPLTVGPADTLWSWGYNITGQLGQNIAYNVNRSSPVQVGGLSTWLNISAGRYFVGATKEDGTLWSWGDNANGQLGQNTAVGTLRSSPVQVGSLTTWLYVNAGVSSCAAIKNNGSLWMWGNNTQGQIGQNNTSTYSSPVQVGSLTTWSKVAIGDSHSIAIKTDGTLWSWGRSSEGQLGQGDTIARSSPVQVGSDNSWSSVSCGALFVTAIKSNNTLWSWGLNSSGQLGQGNTINLSSPVQVGSLTTWNSVSNGGAFCLSIKTDGTLWSWGRGSEGQLGGGNIVGRSSPVQIGSLTTWSYIGCGPGGTTTSAAIKADGTLWTWGAGFGGALGTGNTTYRSSPVQVGSLTNWTKVSSGLASMVATQRGY